MMKLMQGLVIDQKQVIVKPAFVEESVLIRCQKYLIKLSSSNQNILINFWPGEPDKYKCLMDYFFSESFIDYKEACFAFYNGNGQKLIKLLSYQEIVRRDLFLFNIMKVVIKKLK